MGQVHNAGSCNPGYKSDCGNAESIHFGKRFTKTTQRCALHQQSNSKENLKQSPTGVNAIERNYFAKPISRNR
jgi:hypothetical protein